MLDASIVLLKAPLQDVYFYYIYYKGFKITHTQTLSSILPLEKQWFETYNNLDIVGLNVFILLLDLDQLE